MKHSLIKEHIIKTASDLFYQKGYNLTGINEIIKEAGIAKATLYSHFASKEDICLAYLNYKNTTFKKEIKAFIKSTEAGKEQIYAFFYFLMKFFEQKDFNGCWCINTVAEIPVENKRIRNEIQKQKEESIAYIQEIIEKNYNQNSTKENNSLAKKIYLLYESSIAESKLHQNVWPIESGLSLCKNIIN